MFDRVASLIYRPPLRGLAWLLWLVGLMRTGIWLMGNFYEQFRYAVDPFRNLHEGTLGEYVLWNYLNPLSAHGVLVLCKDMPESQQVAIFFIICLSFAALGTALFCYLAITRLDDHAARAALLIYFLMPVSGTAYFWVGMDGLTLLLLLLPFVFPLRMLLCLGAGVLIGLQHFEMGVFAYGALALSQLLKRGTEPTAMGRGGALGTLLGVGLGKALLIGWFALLGIDGRADRLSWFSQYAPTIIGYTLMHAQVVFASVFGVAWLAVLARWRKGEDRLAFFLPLAGLMVLPFLVEDETRVTSMAALPLVTAWLLLNPAYLSAIPRTGLGVLAVLLVVTPYVWVWQGVPRFSAFPYDLALLSNAFTGWPDVPDDLFNWVFRRPDRS